MKKSYLFPVLVLTASVVSSLLQSFIITDSVFKDHFQQLSIERVEDFLKLKDQWAWVNYAILPIIYLLKFTLNHTLAANCDHSFQSKSCVSQINPLDLLLTNDY
ncbi:MAG: hypothetical protein GDA37_10535 [Ekhidna sp.]|nr:hypothetical protein [Ekhidna sp.]